MSAPRISNTMSPSQPSGDVPLNRRPLIGILSQPGDGTDHETKLTSAPGGGLDHETKRTTEADDGTSYIAASYVKFVECGGARVVPLIYNEPEKSLREVSSLTSSTLN